MATSYDAFGNVVNEPGVAAENTGAPKATVLPKAKAKPKGSTFKFPLENQNATRGRISFQPVKIIPPGKETLSEFLNVGKAVVTNVKNAAAGSVNPNAATPAPEPIPNISNMMKYTLLDDKVEMYMPIAYQVNDQLSYGTEGLGLLGGGFVAAAENTSAIGDSIKKFVASGGSASDVYKMVTGASAGDIARAAVTRLGPAIAASGVVAGAAGKIGGGAVALGLGAALGSKSVATVLQLTPNPNNRAIFNGVANREFAFQFKLVPTSSAEAKMIRDIIKFFRINAYPEGINIARVPVAYKFPNMFKIKVQYNGQTVGTRIKLCYLRNISTTYNPTAASYYEDGEPVETDFTLSFVEYIPLVRQDVAGDWFSKNESDIEDQEDARYWDNGGGF